MDQNRRQSSSGSNSSLVSGIQGRSDQTTDSLKSISELNKRLESSLYVSEKPESKSTHSQANEQCTIFQSSYFEESREEISSRQSSLKETRPSSYESSSITFKTPERTKIDNEETSSAIANTANPKQDVGMQKPKTYSRARPEGKVLPNTAYFSSSDSKINPSAYYCNVNPAFLPRRVNPVQKKACAYPGQYPHQNLQNPIFFHKQNTDHSHSQNQTLHSDLVQKSTCINQYALPDRHQKISQQWQVPPTSIRTATEPIVALSRNRRTPHYHNPRPPIRTNATPMQSSQSSHYEKPMPLFKTNETPIRYVQRSSRYRNPMYPVSTDATSRQHIQPLRATTSHSSGRMSCSQDVVQSRQNLTSGQDSKLPAVQTQIYAPKEIENRNISTPNLEQSKKLTKLENLAKSVHYSKKNMLNIDIPPIDQPASYFPLHATPQGLISIRQVQPTRIQFPTTSGSSNFGSTFAAIRGIVPPQPYQTGRPSAQSYAYSYFHPVVTEQAVSRPAKQDNILFQSVSNSGNAMHSAIQAQIMTPQTLQCQPAMQNLTAAPQYQDPNYPIYQYNTQYEPPMQNLYAFSQFQDPNPLMYQCSTQYQSAMQNPTVGFQHQDPNHLMYQCNTQYQSAMQNPTVGFQYQDPNHLMYQCNTQYQFAMQNPTVRFQYQDPNHLVYQCNTQYQSAMQNPTVGFQYQDPNRAIYEYGAHISSDIFRPPDMQWSSPTYDASIPSQQHNINILPMQTFATNSSLNSMTRNPTVPFESKDQSYHFTDDENSVPNFSDVQPSVENRSLISESQYPPGFYETNKSTNPISVDDPSQGSNHTHTQNQESVSMNNPDVMHSNMYTTCSVSTGDPQEDNPIDKRDETSKNQ